MTRVERDIASAISTVTCEIDGLKALHVALKDAGGLGGHLLPQQLHVHCRCTLTSHADLNITPKEAERHDGLSAFQGMTEHAELLCLLANVITQPRHCFSSLDRTPSNTRHHLDLDQNGGQ